MTAFKLQFSKALQAAGVLLNEEAGKRMAYLRLLKLLYISDRESFRTRGRSITGDKPYALEHGPVLSGVYDAIKGEGDDAETWATFIEREHYKIHLTKSPGRDDLSTSELDILKKVSQKYADKDEWDMVKITHKFPEWKRNKPSPGSRRVITLKAILEAVGRTDAETIQEELESDIRIDRMFAKLSG